MDTVIAVRPETQPALPTVAPAPARTGAPEFDMDAAREEMYGAIRHIESLNPFAL